MRITVTAFSTTNSSAQMLPLFPQKMVQINVQQNQWVQNRFFSPWHLQGVEVRWNKPISKSANLQVKMTASSFFPIKSCPISPQLFSNWELGDSQLCRPKIKKNKITKKRKTYWQNLANLGEGSRSYYNISCKMLHVKWKMYMEDLPTIYLNIRLNYSKSNEPVLNCSHSLKQMTQANLSLSPRFFIKQM